MAINDNNAANFPVGIPLGVSGTTNQSYGQNGSLRDILSITSGSADSADKAIAFANQFAPLAPKADPWEAAFQFFAEMGRQSSVPGSTALGAAASSLQAPMDYLTAKKKELRDSEAARTQMALTVGAGLKDPTGKVTYRPATAKELKEYGATAGQMGSDGKFYDLSKTSVSTNNDLKPFGLIDPTKLAEIKRVIPTASLDANGNILLTDAESRMVGVRPYIGQEITPDKSGDNDTKPLTELAKLYDDLNAADEGSDEAANIQQQIDALAKAGGFNKEIFGAEADLRKEWKKFETPYEEIEVKHQKLVSALQRQTGVGDMSAIFVYMKMLDPGSVVRESEFAQAQQTAGAFETIRVRMAQIAEGDKLSEEQRAEFLALANEFRNLSKFYIGQNRLDLGTIVSNNPSLTPSNIFGSELAPPNFYLDTSVFREANSLGFTMDEVWKNMSDDEKADYLPSEES